MKSWEKNINEKIIIINTKKTASNTALVQLCPGNALDTLIHLSQLISDRLVIVFFLALLDPY